MTATPATRQRCRGALIGLAVGDALGTSATMGMAEAWHNRALAGRW